MKRFAAGSLLVAVLGGVAACSDDEPAAAGPTSRAPVAADINTIAGALGCTAQPGPKTKGYKRADCVVASTRYVIYTFDTATDQRDWTEFQAGYGGTYLVGPRWLLATTDQAKLTAAVDVLGGKLTDLRRTS